MHDQHPRAWRYDTGEPIGVGDQIVYGGMAGQVVFVVEDDAFSAGYPKDEWSYLGHGIGLETAGGGLAVIDRPDPCLELRGKSG